VSSKACSPVLPRGHGAGGGGRMPCARRASVIGRPHASVCWQRGAVLCRPGLASALSCARRRRRHADPAENPAATPTPAQPKTKLTFKKSAYGDIKRVYTSAPQNGAFTPLRATRLTEGQTSSTSGGGALQLYPGPDGRGARAHVGVRRASCRREPEARGLTRRPARRRPARVTSRSPRAAGATAWPAAPAWKATGTARASGNTREGRQVTRSAHGDEAEALSSWDRPARPPYFARAPSTPPRSTYTARTQP
jgi:hypothetical protein